MKTYQQDFKGSYYTIYIYQITTWIKDPRKTAVLCCFSHRCFFTCYCFYDIIIYILDWCSTSSQNGYVLKLYESLKSLRSLNHWYEWKTCFLLIVCAIFPFTITLVYVVEHAKSMDRKDAEWLSTNHEQNIIHNRKIRVRLEERIYIKIWTVICKVSSHIETIFTGCLQTQNQQVL